MMAVRTILVDDIDGSIADVTIEFSVNGVNYIIDLNSDNAQHFNTVLEEFVKPARRTGGRAKMIARIDRTAATPVPKYPSDLVSEEERKQKHAYYTQVRAWALAQGGFKVNRSGTVARKILDAYEAANGGS